MTEAERNQKIEEEVVKTKALKDDYVATFSSEYGQRVLADLRKRGFFNKTLYMPGIDAIGLALREGQRIVVIHIDNMMSLDMNKIKEQYEKQIKED